MRESRKGPSFFQIYTEQYMQLTKVFARCIYETYSCCLLYYIFMPIKSRSRNFKRPPSQLNFYKQYNEMEVKLTVSPPPFDFDRYCTVELQERRKLYRYVLDYSTLYFLSISYCSFKKHEEHEGISQVLKLFRQQPFEDHFQYRDGCLLVTKLNLLLYPQKITQKRNKIFDKGPQTDKEQEPAVLNQQQSLAFLAFKIIYFLVEYQPKDRKQVNTAQKRRAINLSIREEIINLILGMQSQFQISQTAKLKMVGLFSFELLETEYYYKLPIQFSQQRFNYGVVHKKVVFNPSSITVQIFKELMKPEKERLLTGAAGIGKSFSLSLLVTLTNFVSDYKIQRQRDSLCSLLDKRQQQKFQEIEKFYYITVGEYSTEAQFIQIMRLQSHDKLFLDKRTDNTKLIQFVSHLNRCYFKLKCQPVVIIDQINLYFSVLRQYELACNTTKMQEWGQKQRKIMFCTRLFQQKLLNSSFSVCYSSSANCELQTIFVNVGCQVIKIPQSHSTIVNFEKLNSTDRFIELINTIYFELEKKLAQKDAFQQIKLRRKQLDTLLRCDFTNFETNNFPSQLTHHRISLYFRNSQQLKELKLFEEGGSDDMHFIKGFETGLLKSIEVHCQDILLHDYKKLLLKGQVEIRHKKILRILADIKQLCQEQKVQQNIIKYSIYSDDVADFYDSFSKENATISQGGQLTIYYSPRVYLKVINKLFDDFNQFAPIFKLLIKQFGSSNEHIRSYMDNWITKILCSQSVKLKIKRTYFLIAHLPQKLSFEHFFEQQKAQYQIQTKLKNVFAALEVVSPGIWVAAEPKIKKQGKPTDKLQQADNSNRIDYLLCRKQKDKYQIKTFDFTLLHKLKQIQEQQASSQNFFTEFVGYAQSQKIKLLQLQHFILAKKENALKVRSVHLQTHSTNLPSIKITTLPITCLEIHIMPRKDDKIAMIHGIYQEAINALCKQD